MSRLPKDSNRPSLFTKHERLDPGAPMSLQVCEINKLRQEIREIQIKSTPKRAGESLGILVNPELVIEDFEPGETYYNQHFQIGDTFLKINNTEIPTRHQLMMSLAAFPEKVLHVTYSRRLHASGVPPDRARALALENGGGFGHFLVTCHRLPGEILKEGFGFKAVSAGGKFYVVDTEPGSPAERYFAVGDALLDVDGVILNANEPSAIKKFGEAFRAKPMFTCVIQRPIADRCRRIVNSVLKTFFPVTDVGMAEDATIIGVEAAQFHRLIFKRMRPASILRAPPMPNTVAKKLKGKKGKNKKNTRSETTVDDEASAAHAPRVSFNDKERQKLVISSDVEDDCDLQTVEPRYSAEEEEEPAKPTPTKKPNVVVAVSPSKSRKKKKSIFSFLSDALD